MEKIVTTLKTYWFLIIALCTLSAAWGQAQIKIKTLEDAIIMTSTTQRQVNDLRIQNERIDERTRSLQESQVRQERMIEMLLTNQRTIIKNSEK